MSLKVLLFLLAALALLVLNLVKPSVGSNNRRGSNELDAVSKDMNTNPASLRNPNRTIGL